MRSDGPFHAVFVLVRLSQDFGEYTVELAVDG
jgi:hypothetical protein